MPNHWAGKTPEEKRAITQKSAETRRRNKLALAKAKDEVIQKAQSLRWQIASYEKRLRDLEEAYFASELSTKLTGKFLMPEADIVAAARPIENVCGVYFLVKGDRVIYVGQSVNVFARIAQHKDKAFERMAFIPCAEDMLDRLESIYIHFLMPEMNGEHHAGGKSAPLRMDELFNLRG